MCYAKSLSRIIFCLLTISIHSNQTKAQTYLMNDTVIYTCVGEFYDTGGPNDDYSPREDHVITFYPDFESALVSLNFREFRVRGGALGFETFFKIYDGNSVSAPLIGVYQGDDNPGFVSSTAADGSLSIRFESGAWTQTGWHADISCCISPFPSNIAVIGNNDLCPGEITTLEISNAFCGRIQWQKSVNSTTWNDIPTQTSRTITTDPIMQNTYYRACFNLNNETVCSDEVLVSIDPGCLIIGEQPVFYNCNGNFYDTGGKFNNYGSNETKMSTITPNLINNKIRCVFSSVDLFEEDTLYIYNGSNNNAPLIGKYTGNLPGFIINSTAEDGSLTFLFESSNNSGGDNAIGWQASVQCVSHVGLEEFTSINHHIFPNPTNGVIQLEIDKHMNVHFPYQLEFCNALGQIVQTEEINSFKTKLQIHADEKLLIYHLFDREGLQIDHGKIVKY